MTQYGRLTKGDVVGAMVLIAGLLVWLLHWRSDQYVRESVAGVLIHDFGRQAIDAPIELQHVFRLTNESGATLHLQRIATTCGCTKAEASSATVAPGAIVEITVRMKVATAGMKREEIRLICTEVEPIVLTLSATVTMMESFYTAVQTVVVAPNEPARVLAVQLRRDDVAPGVLRCEAPAGISASATEWTQVVRSNPQAGRPSRWHAWVRIEQLEQVSMTGNAVTVIDSLGRTERIALDGHLPG